MKYLKKFNTMAEYEAFIASDEFVKPNVSLVEQDNVIFYHRFIKPGVYIQHIDNSIHTPANWTAAGFSNDKANGIAVIDNKASFVIALKEKYYLAWASDTSTLLEGVTTIAHSTNQINDYAGYDNTEAMMLVDTSGAAHYCYNYIFPNGARGYLPSMGEWSVAGRRKASIESALQLVGGTAFNSGYPNYSYWSSTQYDATKACSFSMKNNAISGSTGVNKSNAYMLIRAFAKLDI